MTLTDAEHALIKKCVDYYLGKIPIDKSMLFGY